MGGGVEREPERPVELPKEEVAVAVGVDNELVAANLERKLGGPEQKVLPAAVVDGHRSNGEADAAADLHVKDAHENRGALAAL